MSVRGDIVSNVSSIYSEVQPRHIVYKHERHHKRILEQYQSHIDVHGVRICPKTLVFDGAFHGKKYEDEIRVQNISKTNITVKFGKPASYHFKMPDMILGKLLAPGLSVTQGIKYECDIQHSVAQTQFSIHIDNATYNYEVVVILGKPNILTEPALLDFGIMNVGQGPVRRTLIIRNEGSKTTNFKIDIAPSDMDMVVQPNHGEIVAKSHVTLECSIIRAPLGYNIKEIWIKCDPIPIRVAVEITVIQRELQIFHPNSSRDLTVIEFPKTIIGTERFQHFVLKNVSAIKTTFIIMVEVNKKLLSFDDKARTTKVWPDLDSFKVTPYCGLLHPFKSRVITVIFIPRDRSNETGWVSKAKPRSEYTAFLRVMNVQDNDKLASSGASVGARIAKRSPVNRIAQMIEPITQAKMSVMSMDTPTVSEYKVKKTKSFGSIDAMFDAGDLKSLKLRDDSRYSISDEGGAAKELSSDKLSTISSTDMLTQTPGFSVDRFDIHTVVRQEPIRLRICIHGFSEQPVFKVQPNQIFLEKLYNMDVIVRTVTLINQSIAELKFSYKKMPLLTAEPSHGILNPKQCKDIEIRLKPKNIGLYKVKMQFIALAKTYLCHEVKSEQWLEVGSFDVTVHYELASQAIKKERKLEIDMGFKPKGKKHVEIAFNNPIPKPKGALLGVKKCPKHGTNCDCLVAFPNDLSNHMLRPTKPQYRSIFTGVVRYQPPIDTNLTYPDSKMSWTLPAKSYYDMYIKQHIRSGALNKDSSENLEKFIFKTGWEPHCSVIPKMLCGGEQLKVKQESGKYDPRTYTYFPLTPLQLFRIHVSPKVIRFGKVSTDFPTTRILTISNANHFKIKITLHSVHEDVKFPNGSSIVIGPKSIEVIPIQYHSKQIARNHRIIHYDFNDSHWFDLDLIANTVNKHLVLRDQQVTFKRLDFNEQFQPISLPVVIENIVHCYTKFSWDIPVDSTYEIFPASGVVPPLRKIVCHVYAKPVYDKLRHTNVNLVSESGINENLSITCESILPPKPRVIHPVIETGVLPLNIEKIFYAYILNPTQLELWYKILDTDPIFGVVVYPATGIIKPRSLLKINMIVKINAVIAFEFKVRVEIEGETEVFFMVKGKTEYPQVKIVPSYAKLRRICAHSFDRLGFSIENVGSTEVIITFPLKEENNEFFLSESKTEIISPFDSYSENEQILIKPSGSRKLFIHFEPIDVASYEFHFPIVLNEMIGPVDNDSTDDDAFRTDPMRFLLVNQELYKDEYGFNLPEKPNIPDVIETLRILVLVRDQMLLISQKSLNFYYSLTVPSRQELTHFRVYITNASDQLRTLILRTDMIVESPFTMTCRHTNLKVIENNLILPDIEPQDKIILNLRFSTVEPGHYHSQIPIFVDDMQDTSLYYTIKLYGCCPPPLIKTNVIEIYFAPVPLDITTERIVLIKYEQYFLESEIMSRVPHPAITVSFPKGVKLFNRNEKNRFLKATISFSSKNTLSISGDVVFYDIYGNECPVRVYASADNCLLTTHEFLMAYKELYVFSQPGEGGSSAEVTMDYSLYYTDPFPVIDDDVIPVPSSLYLKGSTVTIYSNEITCENDSIAPCIEYPYYPETNESEMSIHFDKVVEIMEHFFYERLFKCECNARISAGFVSMTMPTSQKSKIDRDEGPTNANRYYTLSQCIKRLLGNDVYFKYFTSEGIPDDDVERIHYFYKILQQLLNFIAAQGGCVSHILPKYLMLYKDYLFVSTEMDKSVKGLSKLYLTRQKFARLSKRLWLDLLIQIFKVVRLFQVTPETLVRHARLINFTSKSTVLRGTSKPRSPDNIPDDLIQTHIPRIQWILDYEKLTELSLYDTASNMYTLSERILLTWLDRHYQYHQRASILWKHIEDCPQPRSIKNFDSDLADALPFICITASYCPYIIDECFSDLFGDVTTPEMALHNAARLIEAWTFLKIGLTLTPRGIVDANPIFMLMITVHLYEALPNLLPCEVLNFQAKLNQTSKRFLKLTTKGSTYYKFFLAGDKGNHFSICKRPAPQTPPQLTGKEAIAKGEKPKKRKGRQSIYGLRILYHAKKIDRASATLIVCGELTPGSYAQSMVFTLVGEPILSPNQTIRIEGRLYDNIERCVEICIPYTLPLHTDAEDVSQAGDANVQLPESKPVEFEILVSTYDPSSLDMFRAWPWKAQQERKIPRLLYIRETSLIIEPTDHRATLNFYVSLFLAQSQIFYLFFLNKEFGDFIVKVILQTRGIKDQLYYKCKISPNCCPTACICKIPEESPYTYEKCACALKIKVPNQNEPWWNCFSNAFQQTLQPNEKQYWRDRIRTSLSHKLIEWLSNDEDTNPSQTRRLTIYKKEEIYYVNIGNPKVKHPEVLKMDNMGDEGGSVELLITVHAPGRYLIKLSSLDGLEKRHLVVDLEAIDELDASSITLS